MVHAAETSLQKLLEGTKQYQIPLYQRPFSWKKGQLERLWSDLVDLSEARFSGSVDETHFIGSVVLAPTPSLGPTGVQEFLVVDGQQRLTTLTILLAAIRDHRARTEDERHLERINEKYLVNKWEDGQPAKLIPTQTDRDAYNAVIRRSAQAGGGDTVGSAYRYFQSQLNTIDDPDDPLDIQRLEEAVISGLSIVCVTAQQGDNAHRIFESLNNTGMQLTQADLIRNYLFMRLPTEAERVYRDHWLPLERRLTSQQLELLFWLDLLQFDEQAKQSNIYTLQQRRLEEFQTEDEIAAEVERFAELGTLLAIMLNPDQEADGKVRHQLERLELWGNTTAYPILLHLLVRRAHGRSSSSEIAEAMQILESYFVRRLIVGKATKSLNRILARGAGEIDEADDAAAALRAYLSSGRKNYASDAEVRAAVQTTPFYWSGKATHRKLVLLWLEQALGSKEHVSGETLTVEHVMPQTPTEEWREALATDLEPEEDLDSVYQGLVHTLGNLTLTGYNPELSNRPFVAKRARLGESALLSNHRIAAHDRWPRPEILKRADELADVINATWPGPVAGTADSDTNVVWQNLDSVLAEIPAGGWTTYGDVATVIGTHPVPLGQRLARHKHLNAHRVLQSNGTISPSFQWLDQSRRETARDVLEDEGVTFDDTDTAHSSQRINAEDLASLSGVEALNGEVPQPNGSGEGRHQQFHDQLREHLRPDVAEGVAAMVEAWTHLGGLLDFGQARETSCFLISSQDRRPWPFTIYPSGRIEVVFQHMTTRPPFDDSALREEFRQRLDSVAGIDIPAAKLELRPSFPAEVLADPGARDDVIKALSWFLGASTGSGEN